MTVSFTDRKSLLTKETEEALNLEVTYSGGYTEGTNTLKLSYNTSLQITASITGTTIQEPILVFQIPRGMSLTYYPTENDVTLGANLAKENPFSKTEDEEGNTLLTYRMIEKVTQVGFNITVQSGYKLKDGERNTIKVSYYNGNTLLKTEEKFFIADNPSVKSGFINISQLSETSQLLKPGQTNYDVSFYKTISTDYNSGVPHYPYEEAKVTVLIPEDAQPGFDVGDSFTPLINGEAAQAAKGKWKVTYYENYSYSNVKGDITGNSKALVFEVLPGESFLDGYYYFSFLDNLYLRFTNPEAGTYKTDITPKIEVKADGEEICMYDFRKSSWYGCYNITFKEFNMGDYFKTSGSSNYTYGSSYNILPEDTKVYYGSILNNTEDIMKNVKVSYTFDEKLYADQLSFDLRENNAGGYPSTAKITYRTTQGKEEEYQTEISCDTKSLSLEKGNAFTYVEVTFDMLGKSSANKTVVTASLNNHEKLNETEKRFVVTRLISADSEVYGGNLTVDTESSYYFYLKANATASISVQTSPTTLNKGDTFTVTATVGSGKFRNLCLYLKMPSEYIFMGYMVPSEFEGSEYTIGSRTLEDGDVLYSLTFTDGKECKGGAHKFSFRIGPEADTSRVQTEVMLPKAVYASMEHEQFVWPAYNIETEEDLGMDVNGDGDREDRFCVPKIPANITINSVNALTTQSYVSSDQELGEDINNRYQFDSTGNYRFYMYNGFNSGNSVTYGEVIIPIPKKGAFVTYKNNTYTSQWDVILSGAVTMKGSFLEGAALTYSVDEGRSYQSSVDNYSSVTHVKVTTAQGKTLDNNESASLQMPFSVSFGEDMSTGNSVYKAYFGTQMKYRTQVQGDTLVEAMIQPSELTAADLELSGTIFKDYNDNGKKDPEEGSNNKYYTLNLYEGSGTAGLRIKSVSANYTTGSYTIGILVPGTYTLHVEKTNTEYYGKSDFFDKEGKYEFTISQGELRPSLKNINMGIVSPRTVNLNFSNVTLIEGQAVRTIVPSLTPALFPGEAISYESMNPSVVTVNDKGVLGFVGEGSAVVKVKVPQISSVAAQGEEAFITREVKVTCQKKGCHIAGTPSVQKSGTGDIGETLVLRLGSSGTATQDLYYYYNESGYCNESGHTASKDVSASVAEDEGTNSEITFKSSSARYKSFRITAQNAGVMKIKFSSIWAHDENNKPEDREITVIVLPNALTKPSFVINPALPNGDNGWYTVIPEVTVSSGITASYVDTWFNKDSEEYQKLTAEIHPVIAGSGSYVFNAYNKTNTETAQDVTSISAASGQIRVDLDKPRVTDISFTAVGSSTLEQIGNFLSFGNFFKEAVRITVSAEDSYSGAARLYYTLPGKGEAYKEIKDSGTGFFDIPVGTNGQVSFYVTDQAGNESETTLLKKEDSDSSLWVVEENGPIWNDFDLQDDEKNAGSIGADGNLWFSGSVTASSQVTDEDSGIAKVSVLVNEGSEEVQFPEAGNPVTEKQTAVAVQKTITEEGLATLKATAEDNAKNSFSKEVTFGIDLTAPLVDYVEEKLVNNIITSTVQITDEGSGINLKSLEILQGTSKLDFITETVANGYLVSFSTQETGSAGGNADFTVKVKDCVGREGSLTVQSLIPRYQVRYQGGENTFGTAPICADQAADQKFILAANTFTRHRYTFKGWRSSQTEEICQPDSAYIMPAENVTFTAVFERVFQDVVYVSSANGDDLNGKGSQDSPVKTMEEALASVKEGGTIILLDTYTGPVTINQQVMMDLNGQEITGSGGSSAVIIVEASGNLTVMDSGEGGSVKGDPTAFEVKSGGSLSIEGGTIYGGCIGEGTIDINKQQAEMMYCLSYAGGSEAAGSNPGTHYVQEGTGGILKENTFTRQGFTFCGWMYENKLYQPGQKVIMPDQDIEVSAVWSKGEAKTELLGTVVFENGRAAVGAEVTVTDKDGQALTTVTDKDGRYNFPNLPDGSYKITITIPNPGGQDQILEEAFAIVGSSVSNDGSNQLSVTEGRMQAVIPKPEPVQKWEEAVEKLPSPADGSASDEEIKMAKSDISSAKEKYDQLTETEKLQADEKSENKLDGLIRRILNIKVIIQTDQAGTQISSDNFEEAAGLLISAQEIENASNVVIMLIVEKKEDIHEIEGKDEIKEKAADSHILFFNISIQKIVDNTQTETISETAFPIKIRILLPPNARNGQNYEVWLYHGGEVIQLEAVKTGNYVEFYSSRYSTYAISYTPVSQNPAGKNHHTEDSVPDLLSGTGLGSGEIQLQPVLEISGTEIRQQEENRDQRGKLDQVPNTGEKNAAMPKVSQVDFCLETRKKKNGRDSEDEGLRQT